MSLGLSAMGLGDQSPWDSPCSTPTLPLRMVLPRLVCPQPLQPGLCCPPGLPRSLPHPPALPACPALPKDPSDLRNPDLPSESSPAPLFLPFEPQVARGVLWNHEVCVAHFPGCGWGREKMTAKNIINLISVLIFW